MKYHHVLSSRQNINLQYSLRLHEQKTRLRVLEKKYVFVCYQVIWFCAKAFIITL